jgi:hypothetical protein
LNHANILLSTKIYTLIAPDPQYVLPIRTARASPRIGGVSSYLPIAIGVDLIDENGPMLAAVSGQIPLTIAVDIEPPHHPPALNRCLPNSSVNSLPLPRDVTRKTHVYRDQSRHYLFSNRRPALRGSV